MLKNFIIFGCSRNDLKFTSKFYDHSVFDINSETEIRKWLKRFTKHKRIDCLINNVALPTSYPSILNNKELVLKVFKTNVVSQINLINEVAKKMVKKKFGRIVSFSSMAAGLLEEGTSITLSQKLNDTCSKIVSKELAKANVTRIYLLLQCIILIHL